VIDGEMGLTSACRFTHGSGHTRGDGFISSNGLIAQNATGDIALAQTMAFTTLVFCQLFNVFNARSEYTSAFSHMFTNRWLWLAVLLGILLQVAVVYLPILNRAFGTRLCVLRIGCAIGLGHRTMGRRT
jgi:magnesium-transporting ATPase (P-type)